MTMRIPLPKQCPKVFKDKKKYDRRKSRKEVKEIKQKLANN